jgi:hypothetical protein
MTDSAADAEVLGGTSPPRRRRRCIARSASRNLAVGDCGSDVAPLNAAFGAFGVATSDQLDSSPTSSALSVR